MLRKTRYEAAKLNAPRTYRQPQALVATHNPRARQTLHRFPTGINPDNTPTRITTV